MSRIGKVFLAATFFTAGLSLILITHPFSSEKILAKVGDRVITQKEMDGLVERYVQYKPKKGEPLTLDEKKQLLDRMVSGILMAKEAEKEKLGESPEVKEKIRAYREEILVQEYIMKKVAPTVKVTDEEIEQKLKDNPNLVPGEVLRMKEIVVKTEKEAMQIYEELLKGGDFPKIAVAKSIGPTADQGGQLKMVVTRGILPKPLEEAAFSLKNGEFSKPIKSDKGYTILYLTEKKIRTPEEIKKLEETVKGKIKQIEESRKLQAEIFKRAEELNKQYKVEVHYDAIQ